MSDLALLESRLGDHAAVVRAAAAEVRADRRRLAVLFPGLPRRFGREPVGGGRVRIGPSTVDLDAWRRCDAAAAALLASVAIVRSEAWELYEHGDIEERAMLLRSMHVLPPGETTVRLLAEVQRTNMVLHVEAACCDGDLLQRTAGQPGFGTAEQNRLLLKLAFLDLPLQRVFGGEQFANPELSRMLQDLATEREAAGRPVWRDTDRLLGRAPVAGSVARILGGLEHGDDGRRLAAAEGLLALRRPDLAAFARERLPREPRAAIQKLLSEAAG
jgi:hypothetical protein